MNPIVTSEDLDVFQDAEDGGHALNPGPGALHPLPLTQEGVGETLDLALQ